MMNINFLEILGIICILQWVVCAIVVIVSIKRAEVHY